MAHEGQSAQVHLGPLKCQPKQNQYDIKEHLKSVEKKIDDNSYEQDSKFNELLKWINECLANPCQNQGTCVDIEDGYTCQCVPGTTGTNCEIDINECLNEPCLHGTCFDELNRYRCECDPGYYGQKCDSQTPPCPTNEANYALIDEKCIYFEIKKLNYDKAQENCATKFPGGRLFEPRTKSIFDKVCTAIKEVTGEEAWFRIGITDQSTEGIWRYPSTGNKVSDSMSLPWASSKHIGGTDKNCVETYSKPSSLNFQAWSVYSCANGERSICESP